MFRKRLFATGTGTAAGAITSSAASGIDPVSQAVNAGTQIAKTISEISDTNQRRNFEEALSMLTAQQQYELNQQLAASGDATDRFAILSSQLSNELIGLDNGAKSQETALYVIATVLAVVCLGGAIYYSTKVKG